MLAQECRECRSGSNKLSNFRIFDHFTTGKGLNLLNRNKSTNFSGEK